ncbi:hypothetical protein J1605_016904 [Eschrichtius robustus]|uniref:Uncharacterized protein n=1 Tax=Eschrichtius robustus TaxID=9764 RepID=A0AB34I4N8_ESCRO|nr:hypothetical protein J1605_016904 [Eschrichtius robustus]
MGQHRESSYFLDRVHLEGGNESALVIHLTLVCLEACLSASSWFLEVKGGLAHPMGPVAPGTDLACSMNVSKWRGGENSFSEGRASVWSPPTLYQVWGTGCSGPVPALRDLREI